MTTTHPSHLARHRLGTALRTASLLVLLVAILLHPGAATAQNCVPQQLGGIGGGPVAVARVSNTIIGVSRGDAYQLVNISSPASPVAGGSLPLPDLAIDMDAVINFTYVLTGGRDVYVIENAPFASPQYAGGVTLPDFSGARGIDVTSTHGCVVTRDFLYTLDTTIVQLPAIRATFDPELFGDLTDVAVTGNIACVTSYNNAGSTGFMFILDISNLAAPVYRGSVFFNFERPLGVVVSGATAYVAFSDGIRTVDLTNITAPVIRDSLFHTSSVLPQRVHMALDGAFLHVAFYQDSLRVYNVTNPASISLAQTIPTQGISADVAINTATRRSFLADAEGGLRIFDLTAPAAPVQLGAWHSAPGRAIDVIHHPSLPYAFVADGVFGVRVLNTTNTAAPTLAASLDLPGTTYDIALSGNLLFAASSAGLHTIDVTNPAAPVLRSTTLPASSFTRVTASGATVVATTFNSYGVYNAANPTSLVQLYSGPAPSAGASIVSITLSGTRLVIAQYDAVSFIDLTNPAAPVLRSQRPDAFQDVEISGNHLYGVGGGVAWFKIYDIASLANPILRGERSLQGKSVVLSGPNATVLGIFGDLYYLDIADVTNPLLLSTVSQPFHDASAITLAGITLSVADGLAGVKTFQRFTNYQPIFRLWAQPVTAGPRCTVTFSVQAIGLPAPAYQWYLDDQPLAEGTHPSGVVATGTATSSLTLSNLNFQFSGSSARLGCRATNTCGVRESANFLTFCRSDINCNGLSNSQDFFDFISAFFGNAPSADYNADGVTNSQDFFDFLVAFFAGC